MPGSMAAPEPDEGKGAGTATEKDTGTVTAGNNRIPLVTENNKRRYNSASGYEYENSKKYSHQRLWLSV